METQKGYYTGAEPLLVGVNVQSRSDVGQGNLQGADDRF
jgi:hypothetical protein